MTKHETIKDGKAIADEETAATLAEHYEDHRDQYLEQHRRALFAYLGSLMEVAMDDKQPVIGIAAILVFESGHSVSGSGSTPAEAVIVGAEELKHAAILKQFAANANLQSLLATDGDNLHLRDGKAIIAREPTAEAEKEADEAKRVNAKRFGRAASRIISEFYNNDGIKPEE